MKMKNQPSGWLIENTIHSDGRRVISLSLVPRLADYRTGPSSGALVANHGGGLDQHQALPLSALPAFEPEIRLYRPIRHRATPKPKLQLRNLP